MVPKKEHAEREEALQKVKEETKLEVPEKSLEEQIAELKEQLAAKEDEARENYNKFLRALADLDNYKRRANQEREQLLGFGTESLIAQFLPVLDNLERALGAAKGGANPEKLVQGVELILRQFEDVLTKQDVTPIKAVGEPFDPTKHEAIMQVETAEHDDGVVLEELERGYMLKSKLLRPSRVRVAKRIDDESKKG